MTKIWLWLKKDNRLIVVALGIALIISLFLHQCSGDRPTETTSDTIRVSDTIRDLRVCTTQVTHPPVVVHDTIELPPTPIDSLAVYMAYFTRTEYNWLLCDDSSDYAQLNFSIYMNKPDSGEYIHINRRPLYVNNTQIINNTIKERNFKLFVGGSIGGNLTGFDMGLGVMVQYRSFLTGCEYRLFSKSVNVPLYYKLSLKKRKR